MVVTITEFKERCFLEKFNLTNCHTVSLSTTDMAPIAGTYTEGSCHDTVTVDELSSFANCY